MGRAIRPRPQRLAEKLLHIRTTLELSQNGVIRRMGLVDEITQDYISAYERDVREPPLTVLLKYAQVAGVYVDALIDDNVDLPEKLPVHPKQEGIKRIVKSQNKKKPRHK
jgi:transcriptional regulator with XRE-family HTH domain